MSASNISGNIESLYKANNTKLYSASPYTHDTGTFSFGPRQPFVYVNPNQGRDGLNGLKRFESRLFPFASSLQHAERIGKFLLTADGITFLATQFSLQRFQPFNETRIYNPTSTFISLINPLSDPHPQRHLEGGLLGMLAGLVGINVSKPSRVPGTIGTLASESSNNFKGLLRAQTANKALNRFTISQGGAGGGSDGLLSNLLSRLGGPIGAAVGIFNSFMPQTQNGRERADEIGYELMLGNSKLTEDTFTQPTPQFGIGDFLTSLLPFPTSVAVTTNKVRQRWYNEKNTKKPNIERSLRLPNRSYLVDHTDDIDGETIGYDLDGIPKYSDAIKVNSNSLYANSDILLVYNRIVTDKRYEDIPGSIIDKETVVYAVDGTYTNKLKNASTPETRTNLNLYDLDEISVVNDQDANKNSFGEFIGVDADHVDIPTVKRTDKPQNITGTYTNKLKNSGPAENRTNLDISGLSDKSIVDDKDVNYDSFGEFVGLGPEYADYTDIPTVRKTDDRVNITGTYSNKHPINGGIVDSEVINKFKTKVEIGDYVKQVPADKYDPKTYTNRLHANKDAKLEDYRPNNDKSGISIGSSLDPKEFNAAQQDYVSVESPNRNQEISDSLNSMLSKIDSRIYTVDKMSDVDTSYDSLVSHRPNKHTLNGYEKRIKDNGTLALEDDLGKGFSGTGKADKINVLTVLTSETLPAREEFIKYNPYTDDQIAFYFHDLVNDRYIPFRATVKGIGEQLSAQWSDVKYIGRADTLHNYIGFTRALSFNFSVVAMSIEELLPMWTRINYLAGLVKPSKYTPATFKFASQGEAINQTSNFIVPPLVTVTIGDLYKEQPFIIQTIGITIPEDALWETCSEQQVDDWEYLNGKIKWAGSKKLGKFAQFPRECEISIAGPLLEQERPQVGKHNFGGIGVNGGEFSNRLII